MTAHDKGLVLFICTGNYYRSRFAEALFNYYARLVELPWRAVSRGLTPHLIRGDISPQTEDALLMRGISLEHTAPEKQALSEDDLLRADLVIALKEAEHRPLMRLYFPDWVDRIEYWSPEPSNGLGTATVLRQIENSVQELVTELARELVR